LIHKTLTFLVVFEFFLTLPAFSSPWSFLYQQDDIKVYTDNESPPTFKAEGAFAANMLELLAVLSDVPRRPEWVKGLVSARVVDGDPEEKVLIYSLYDLPWPASDRDSLIESVITKDVSNREIKITFKAVEDSRVKPILGVTRVPVADGVIVLKKLSSESVYVSYEVKTDSGGDLPKWITTQFTKHVPLKTLLALRGQMIKTKGQYQDFMSRNQDTEFFKGD
jgi:hypothetical protein